MENPPLLLRVARLRIFLLSETPGEGDFPLKRCGGWNHVTVTVSTEAPGGVPVVTATALNC
jgi:hypothetical protein